MKQANMNGQNVNDVEDPSLAGEGAPLLAASAATATATVAFNNGRGVDSTDTLASASIASDPFANDMDCSWPSTFDRGIKILAGPVLDERVIDECTRSPSVTPHRMLRKNQTTGYYTPDAGGVALGTPGTPAWLKKGLVRMKSLDYTFSDQNLAVRKRPIKTDWEKKKIDSHAYRLEVLKRNDSGGQFGEKVGSVADLSSAAMAKDEEEERLLRSPGYRREKQMDYQKKEEKMAAEHGGGKNWDQKSSFLQCTFNMANILMGVGMLGLPYVFKSAGYVGGFFTTVGLSLVTWRTSYYLGRELNGDPRPVHMFEDAASAKASRNPTEHPSSSTTSATATSTRMRKPIANFPGIAREAFGKWGCVCLSVVLYFELFSCLAIFLVSVGDHLHALFPSVSQARHATHAAFILILPSAILRTPKLLSYLSAIGTFATVFVVLAVVISATAMALLAASDDGGGGDDGAGGSAAAASEGVDADFVPPEYTVYNPTGLPLALGIVAYCFSGHAIVPSIYSSMQKPQEFERMVDASFAVALVSCLLVGVSGYYMFGDGVDDQVTLSLEEHSNGADNLMTMLTWLMILTSGSKFTLTMFPLALGFEEMLTDVLPSDLAMEVVDSVVKIVLIFLSLAVAVFFPSFSLLCSLVGLICTMIVSIIFPAMAHLKLFGPRLAAWEKITDWLFIVGGCVAAIVGTIATVEAGM